MSPPSRYEIELMGRVTERVLRPALDDFLIDVTDRGTTRLVGDIRDASHLNGLLAHFTSLNVEIVEVQRTGRSRRSPEGISSTHSTNDSPEKGTES